MEENKKEQIEFIKKSFELKHLKRYKEAIEMLYKAMEFDNSPQDNVELLSQIGDLHLLLNNYDRALDEFQRALSLNKHHIYSIQKCYEIYSATNQYQKALKTASNMCEENKTPQSYYNYINALIKLNKLQDALEVFNSLDDTIKLDSDILYLISTITNDKKELILEKIISIDQSHTKANLDLAKIELEKGNLEKVIRYCLNIEDDNPVAFFYLAQVESKRQNYIKAIDLYTRAIKIDNDEHDFYFDLAKAYIDVFWFDEALMALKQSVNYSILKQDNKKRDEKYFLISWILIKQNKDSKALLNLNTIDKNSDYYKKAQILIQLVNLKHSKLSDVVINLEKYLQTEEKNPILIDTLASAYKELKLYKKAIKTYKTGLAYYPDSIYYLLEIIDLLIDEKDYKEAKSLIDDLLARFKNCASVYNSLARIYYRLKDNIKALDAINEYLNLDNNNAEAYYFKGLILNDLSDYESARNNIYSAIKLNPAVAKYYSQMARSYAGLKEYESALLYSKEAIEINPDEINYKKQAYDISLLIGDESKIKTYLAQLKRSEKVLKFKR